MKEALLTSAAEAYKKGHKDFCTTMCEEGIKLFRFQKEVEEKIPAMKSKLLDKSVNATCRVLLEANELKLAEKFRNDFKIPDKRVARVNKTAASWLTPTLKKDKILIKITGIFTRI
ncbi:unnamed protein product [Acanthoscelides obtectus]|uniref:Vps16 C-terminal domain-containing protein n=1 Tax=Acanthoscelides obtectus TaxID=200917 RepID=A0A9P0Q477_ACAOB|nr:unnamed protein product [Acanthoscelides obtectus]CAK1655901.1 Vacuolar protein sorting-associated protein 16 homolog [Acanthoscelides obtectus]